MKKLVYLLLIPLLAGCNKDQRDGEPPTSNWGKPLTVIEYQDAAGTEVWESTTYYYDQQGRLTGYRSVNWNGSPNEEMLNSKFEGSVHTYDLHSWEWIGGPLPVVFHYTDTYTDATFTTLATRHTSARNMDRQETITYRYEDGRPTSYRTVVAGQRPDEFDTLIIYITDPPGPSATTFPHDVVDEDNRVEMVYTNSEGNRTGYYSDNDYSRAQWNFDYRNGYCTYYTSQFGRVDMPHLVRMIFLNDNL